MVREQAQRMHRLFEGFADAHGTHGETSSTLSKGGKKEIKKNCVVTLYIRTSKIK